MSTTRTSSPPGAPRNVLWITCDEMRADVLPACGNPLTSLPAAERLAREGLTCERAYCQVPKCVPSRCSMITGRYPHTDGLRTLRGRAGFQPAPKVPENDFLCLLEHVPNLVSLAREWGYRTGLLGKNHLVDWNVHETWFDRTPSWDFQRLRRFHGSSPLLERAYFAGAPDPDQDLARHEDAVTADEAIAFLERERGRPFLLLMDMAWPHPRYVEVPGMPVLDLHLSAIPLPPRAPLAEAPSVQRRYRETFAVEDLGDDDRRRVRRAYYSMAEFADRQVARVLQALDRLGLAENTLVIYTADHGDFAGDHGCFEKWDTLFYEGLVHVPLLLRLPGVIPAGQRCEALLEMVDVLPTVLEWLGHPIPGSVQGRSFRPLAEGRPGPTREFVFAEGGVEDDLLTRPHRPAEPSLKQLVLLRHPETMSRAKMIRTEQHKLVYRARGESELYDLRLDPFELRNVAGLSRYQQVRRQLEERLLEHLVATESNLPAVAELHA